MPASRAVELPDKLSSRSYTGRAEAPAAGALIITSYVLPAAMNTSLCTQGTSGKGLPSSAISEKPPVGVVVVVVTVPLVVVVVMFVCAPTIDGTCMRKPALTKRTRTFPVTVPGVTENCDPAALVLLNATPLIR